MAKMSPSTTSSAATLILISAVVALSSIATTSAFNITRILEQYPDFSQFNSLLSQTHLAEEINRRATITVLALANGRISEISGKPEDVQKRILSTHVILDYYDILKLNKLKDTKTVLTNLYQATGTAGDQQGFLVVTHKANSILFGSAMKGAPIDAQLEGSVVSQPYNISVLSISHPIIASGIDGTLRPVSAPPQLPTAPAPAAKVTPPAESPEEEKGADAPTIDEDAPAPAGAPADAPKSDAPPADAEKNAAGKQLVSGASVGLIVALASFLAAQ